MSDGTGALTVAGSGSIVDAAAMPSMNEALRKWIDLRTSIRAGKFAELDVARVSDNEKVSELSAEYGRLEQAGIAFSVLQGFVLAQAAALGEKPLLRVIQENDVPRAIAYAGAPGGRTWAKVAATRLAGGTT